jgi:hypothetical protein
MGLYRDFQGQKTNYRRIVLPAVKRDKEEQNSGVRRQNPEGWCRLWLSRYQKVFSPPATLETRRTQRGLLT